MEIKGKNVIITGGTSGIGKEAAFSMAAKNASIILPSRNLEKGEMVRDQIIDKTGNKSVHIMKCDLASFDSIRSFVSEFKERYDNLHLLVNNAGIWETKKKESADGIELNFAVNHLAPFLLTSLLVDELRRGAPARIINVSSDFHRHWKMDFNDPESKKRFSSIRSYGRSKLANILFTRYLADITEKEGITVNAMHPGFVATNLFDRMTPFFRKIARPFMISSREGAATIVYLATSPDLEGVTGEYFVRKKMKKPSGAARNRKSAEKLWNISREYTGV